MSSARKVDAAAHTARRDRRVARAGRGGTHPRRGGPARRRGRPQRERVALPRRHPREIARAATMRSSLAVPRGRARRPRRRARGVLVVRAPLQGRRDVILQVRAPERRVRQHAAVLLHALRRRGHRRHRRPRRPVARGRLAGLRPTDAPPRAGQRVGRLPARRPPRRRRRAVQKQEQRDATSPEQTGHVVPRLGRPRDDRARSCRPPRVGLQVLGRPAQPAQAAAGDGRVAPAQGRRGAAPAAPQIQGRLPLAGRAVQLRHVEVRVASRSREVRRLSRRRDLRARRAQLSARRALGVPRRRPDDLAGRRGAAISALGLDPARRDPRRPVGRQAELQRARRTEPGRLRRTATQQRLRPRLVPLGAPRLPRAPPLRHARRGL
mmetsp:Transcript_21337/g.84869  ORF Transcript_21337/g.84869 Transcript_21337/m.84869 type:complete len:380 (+) Transcript_21337:406-1545(+)